MKKNYYTILLFLIATSVFSQENKKNIFKINIVPIFSGVYELQYERVLNEKSSIQLGFGTGNKIIDDIDEFQELHLETFGRNLNKPRNVEYSEKTFLLNFDYRYYLKGYSSPKGLYLSPSIQYLKYKERFFGVEYNNGSSTYVESVDEREFKLVNLRALVGYQFIIANTISFNPYFGPSFAIGNATDFFDNDDRTAKGFGLNMGAYLGINF